MCVCFCVCECWYLLEVSSTCNMRRVIEKLWMQSHLWIYRPFWELWIYEYLFWGSVHFQNDCPVHRFSEANPWSNWCAISQNISSSGPYEQNELYIFVENPSCYGDPTNMCASKFSYFPRSWGNEIFVSEQFLLSFTKKLTYFTCISCINVLQLAVIQYLTSSTTV